MHTAHENLVPRQEQQRLIYATNGRTIQTAAAPNERPHNARPVSANQKKKAGDGIRTHDNDVGNVVLYQLSYARTFRFAVQTPNQTFTAPQDKWLPCVLGVAIGLVPQYGNLLRSTRIIKWCDALARAIRPK